MDKPQSIMDHLKELRQRIVYTLLAVVIGISVSFVFAHRALIYVLNTAKTNAAVELVQFRFSDTFMSEFRLAVIAGLVLAFPFILYQLAAFILPALRPSERRILYFGLPFATLMFLLGWSFGWFVVVPITKRFFIDIAASADIANKITPAAYLDFVLGICNPLGIAFELPLVILIVARIGLVSSRLLSRIRKYAFLGILVLAAVLSPPDVVSMTIFLVPLYGLYEFSILLARFAEKRRK